MSDIITTLHPENDEKINLYPNIKKENIPDNSVDENKIDGNYTNRIFSAINSQNEKIDNLVGGSPKYTNTSANILSLTENKGVAVATDNGHWYYWNGTQYVDGGLYLTATIDCLLDTGLVITSFDDFEEDQQTTAAFTAEQISTCAGVKLTIAGQNYVFIRYGMRIIGGWNVYDFKYTDEATNKTYYYSYTPQPHYVWYGILNNFIYDSNITLENFTNTTKTIQFNWDNNVLKKQFILVNVDENECIFTKTKTYIATGNVSVTSFTCENMLMEIAIVNGIKYVFYQNLIPVSDESIVYNDIYVGENETYTNIKEALDSITDNSKDNRYRVHIKEGVYDVPYGSNAFGLKNYVYIIGENKTKSIIRHLYSNTSYDSTKNGFDLGIYQDSIEESSIENLTIITKGCKAPIHLDSDYNYLIKGGKITISNCILIDMNTINNIGISWEQYGFSGAGGVNVGLRDEQQVEVKDTISNGLIYAHNVYSSNRTYRKGAIFKVSGCQMSSTMIGDLDSGAHDIWQYDNNKIRWFIINYNPVGSSQNPKWSIDLKLQGNKIERMYSVYGGNYDASNEFGVFNQLFNGKWAFISDNIHQLAYNDSNVSINKGELVEIINYEKSNMYGTAIIKLTNNFKIYAYALEDISAGEFGLIQYNGVIRFSVNGSCSVGDKLIYDFNNGYFKLANANERIDAIANENKSNVSTNAIEIKLCRM